MLDYRTKYEAECSRSRELEAELASMHANLISNCEGKDKKIKELHHAQAQIKTECKMYMKRVKELELEVQRLRNELEDERSKRADAESLIKVEQLKES